MFKAVHGVKGESKLKLRVQPCNNSPGWGFGSEKSRFGIDVSTSILCSSSGEKTKGKFKLTLDPKDTMTSLPTSENVYPVPKPIFFPRVVSLKLYLK